MKRHCDQLNLPSTLYCRLGPDHVQPIDIFIVCMFIFVYKAHQIRLYDYRRVYGSHAEALSCQNCI